MQIPILSSPIHLLLFITILLIFCTPAFAAEWSKLKTCSDLGFCRRHRHFALEPSLSYVIASTTIKVEKWEGFPALVGALDSASSAHAPLNLAIAHFGSGIFRVVLTETKPMLKRYVVKDALADGVGPLSLDGAMVFLADDHAWFTVKDSPTKIRIWYAPFRLEYISSSDGKVLTVINEHSRLFVEHLRKKPSPEPTPEQAPASTPDPPSPTPSEASPESSSSDGVTEPPRGTLSLKGEDDTGEDYDYDDDAQDDDGDDEDEDLSVKSPKVAAEDGCSGCWEETFKSQKDSKPRGPESLGTDISFPFASHIYGIPERTTRFSLEDTVNAEGEVISEPFRLYNLDVFEFELDKPFGLYGSIPFLMARNGKETVGMLWLNSAETYVDVRGSKKEVGKDTHWYSESGIIDIYLIPGPTSADVFHHYLYLTGAPAMPQRFALGYHQCRWNYRDEEDVKAVDAAFDERDIPYDVLWLDIEHTHGKRYFTWDYSRFPDPTALQNHIGARGRKMVTIIDPHIKRDNKYQLHRFANENKYYVMKPDGKTFDGWCWPGSSSYMDFTAEKVRDAWASRFNPTDYPHFTEHLYTWNDMNEPSVFNGPEGTMQKDLLHAGETEHRHIHNLYGHYFMQATYEGLKRGHGGNDRPFVLSRSFFAGSQRYGAVWTGDNAANWEHLGSSVRMLLSLQISGLTFAGADVGGFFGNPSAELLTRWYQAGAFQPFFRGHAHLDTNRREPWVFGEPYTGVISHAIRTRYQYLPLWYTLFAANVLGRTAGFATVGSGPPMRPVWWEFPEEAGFDADETAWLVGNALLVAPVMKDGATEHVVRLPGGARWYDLYDPAAPGRVLDGTSELRVDAKLERMVVLQRGGTIVPKWERRRRCARAMSGDPFTLVVALDAEGRAEGELYLDDGRSFAYAEGRYVVRRFTFENNVLRASTVGGEGGCDGAESVLERVVVLGYGKPASRAAVGGRDVGVSFAAESGVLVVRQPGVGAGLGDWELNIYT